MAWWEPWMVGRTHRLFHLPGVVQAGEQTSPCENAWLLVAYTEVSSTSTTPSAKEIDFPITHATCPICRRNPS